MQRRRLFGLLAGASSALAIGLAAVPASAQELTIFWAEWDPANYLQELVNEYTEETGVTVTVETTPWSDFQTKAFTEFNAKGDATTWSWATASGWARARPAGTTST